MSRLKYFIPPVLIFSGLIFVILSKASEKAKPEVLPVIYTMTSSLAPTDAKPLIVPIETETIVTLVTTTNTPLSIFNYVFDGGVDLSSGRAIFLAIFLPEGGLLSSNWANAVAFQEDDADDVFDPNKGTIYSYSDEGLTVTWAHSGVAPDTSKPLFADNFDRYLRKTVDQRTMNLAQAQEKAKSLIGSMAILCQDETGTMIPMTRIDSEGECLGKKVALEVVAFTIVPNELVSEYDKLSLGIWQWMIEKFPGDGYENLAAGDSWIVRFCMGGYYDQPGSKTWYFLNRGVIAFRVIK